MSEASIPLSKLEQCFDHFIAERESTVDQFKRMIEESIMDFTPEGQEKESHLMIALLCESIGMGYIKELKQRCILETTESHTT